MNITSSRRRILIAVVALIAAIFSLPSTASAQIDCRCDYYFVTIHKDVTCRLQVCWADSPFGNIHCDYYGPGTVLRIPCFAGQTIRIRRCDGTYINLLDPTLSRCIDFKPESDCCVRSCISTDADRCTHFDIHGIPCAYDGCP